MLENLPEELQTLILLQFTEKLVIGTSPTIFLKEMNKPKTKSEKFKATVKSKIPNLVEKIPQPRTFAPPQMAPPPSIRVPEMRLPPQFAYLRPNATTAVKLDLGKLNPLLDDPAISVIESNGPNQYTIVRGRMGTKPTQIVLTKEEIDQILQTFSKKSKIPIGEGVTKIVLGNLSLSAIISPEGSRFSIKKIPPVPPSPMMPRR